MSILQNCDVLNYILNQFSCSRDSRAELSYPKTFVWLFILNYVLCIYFCVFQVPQMRHKPSTTQWTFPFRLWNLPTCLVFLICLQTPIRQSIFGVATILNKSMKQPVVTENPARMFARFLKEEIWDRKRSAQSSRTSRTKEETGATWCRTSVANIHWQTSATAATAWRRG